MRRDRDTGCAFFAAAFFAAAFLLCPPEAGATDRYNVALLSFPGPHGIPTEQSRIVTDLLASGLSADPRIQLVERDRLGSALSELGLSLTGIVEPDQAVSVGSMAGAEILIMGRLTRLGMKNAIFARIMGIETSRVETMVVSASQMDPLPVLADDLAEMIVETIAARGPLLVGAPGGKDPDLEALRERLRGRTLPSLSLSVREIFGGVARQQSTAEAELLRMLIELGFEVYEQPHPGVDVIVTAQALGEFAARRGGLVSSSAELKVKAVTAKEKKVLASARTRQTVADLSEEAAASRAFGNSVAAAAPDLIILIVEKWNE
jgi:hypothetical protein